MPDDPTAPELIVIRWADPPPETVISTSNIGTFLPQDSQGTTIPTDLRVTGELTVGTTPAISGFGTSIGQALGPLISSGGGGVATLQTTNTLLFRRSPTAYNDSTDFQYNRTADYTGSGAG